ncbi:MAG: polyhydroxyalkanoate synthesis regulator phasin [Oleispira sp.]|jgi:polyhydroxyalkanoate synthesis regulator phasin|tara:strand:- start:3930 stop:4364 length:435 start_codon:yes stop_codon:yes gene_type:complete
MSKIENTKEVVATKTDEAKAVVTSNLDKIKETANSAEEMARKIWLAGLGAYGKGYEEVKGRIESLSTESNKLFDDLVVKGEKLETEGKDKVKQVKDDVLAKTEVEARIETVRSKLGFGKTDEEVKLEELSAKIEELTAAIAKLS